MKKLALFDPYLLKFTSGMIKWWELHGYEVRYERYFNPELVQWADVVFFHTADNNLRSATAPPADNPDFAGYDIHEMDLSNKQIIVQPIDIEIWQGHHLASRWDVVDDVIFIAPHIREIAMVETLPERKEDLRVHTIPFSVDLDRYYFREHEPGFEIAVISEKWVSKGTDLILQIALKLKEIDPRYKITWLGRWSDYQWEQAYFTDFVEHHGLNMEFVEWIDAENAVNEFLEDKNYLLHASHKEAFSMATAEAMAKGIKPVVHRFYGADDLWPSMTWDSIEQAVEAITMGDYDSHSYRQYLINHGYTLDQMMEAIEKIINKGEKQ
jgi:glycosyltransferase involved in cell wall biosynthesis